MARQTEIKIIPAGKKNEFYLIVFTGELISSSQSS
jgi:hypothetical protein